MEGDGGEQDLLGGIADGGEEDVERVAAQQDGDMAYVVGVAALVEWIGAEFERRKQVLRFAEHAEAGHSVVFAVPPERAEVGSSERDAGARFEVDAVARDGGLGVLRIAVIAQEFERRDRLIRPTLAVAPHAM